MRKSRLILSIILGTLILSTLLGLGFIKTKLNPKKVAETREEKIGKGNKATNENSFQKEEQKPTTKQERGEDFQKEEGFEFDVEME